MTKTENHHACQGDKSEGFYSRWSKRKARERSLLQAKKSQEKKSQAEKSRVENQSELPEGISHSLESMADKGISPETDQEKTLLCDRDMPDINTLDEDSDYSGFLSPGVSEELRKLALRKLFQGQRFNCCDGLDDYDEEFTAFEKLGDIVTADMRFQLEEEAKRKLQQASEDEISINKDEVAIVAEDGNEEVNSDAIPTAIAVETAPIDKDDRNRNDKKSLPDNENLS